MKKNVVSLFLMVALIFLAGCGKELEVPAGLSAVGDANGIFLTWNAVSSGELTGYKVYRRALGGNFAVLGATAINATQYSDTSAEVGTLYDYYVTAVGKEESGPSAIVTNVRGTRLTNQSGDFAIPAGETRVVEGAVSVGGDLTVPVGTKLYIFGSSVLTFSDTTQLSVFTIRGLCRTIAGPGNPASIVGSGTDGFTIYIDGATSYNKTTGEGTMLSYALIDKLGRVAGGSSLSGIFIQGCVPRLAQLKVRPMLGSTLNFYVKTMSGAIIEHCSFQKMTLSMEGDLRGTSTEIHGNTFTRGYYAAFFANSSGPNINASQVTGNSFECTGAGDFSLYNVTGAGSIFLGGNFFHNAAGVKLDPGILYTGSSVTFDTANLLNSEPADVGPEW